MSDSGHQQRDALPGVAKDAAKVKADDETARASSAQILMCESSTGPWSRPRQLANGRVKAKGTLHIASDVAQAA